MGEKKVTYRLAERLQKGEALVLPTETVYGLFAKADDQAAVNHVYALKRRPRHKAMNLNVASLEEIYYYSKDQPYFLPQLFEQFLPGPLTIVLKRHERVPIWISSEMETVGFRLPNHPTTLEIIRLVGPLIGPSANISGKASGTRFLEVLKQFDEPLNGLSDDTWLTGQDSTILDLTGEQARILRQGAVTAIELQSKIPGLFL